MQHLHLVGFTTDLEGLIFSARKGSKSGSFLVKLDDGLLATIEEAERLRNGGEANEEAVEEHDRAHGAARRPRPESVLSPREIQARLRAGSTIANVAKAAGVDEEWVGRFAAPILAEQHQVVERARQLVFSKARLGPSAQPLGTSVIWNLADRGVRLSEDVYEDSWRAWNLHGAVWIVRFEYSSRQRAQAADWEVDLREGTLHARNRVGADLGYIEPGRRRRAAPVLLPAERPAAAQPAPPSGPTRRAPAPKPATRPAKVTKATKASRATKATRATKKTARPAKKTTRKAAAPTRRGVAARATTRKASGAKKATAARATSARKATTGRTAKKTASARKATRGSAAAKGPLRGPTGGAAPAPRGAVVTDERVSHLARPPSPHARPDAARVLTPGVSPAAPLTLRPMVSRGPAGADPNRASRPGAASSPRPAPRAETRPTAPKPAPAPVYAEPTFEDHISPTVVLRRPQPQPAVAPAETPAGATGGTPGADGPARRPAPAPERPTRTAAPSAAAPARAPAPPPRPVAARAPAVEPTPAPQPRPRPGPSQVVAQPGPRPATSNGRQRLPDRPEPDERHRGADDESVWGGPGSGQPAPAVRIRADLAAAADARQTGAKRIRRSGGRDRPLRAR